MSHFNNKKFVAFLNVLPHLRTDDQEPMISITYKGWEGKFLPELFQVISMGDDKFHVQHLELDTHATLFETDLSSDSLLDAVTMVDRDKVSKMDLICSEGVSV